MGQFEYSLEIGDYNSKTRVKIEVKLQFGMSAEDYTKLKEAFDTIEKIVAKTKEERKEEVDD